MKTKPRATIAALASSVILLGTAAGANAQERRFFQDAPKQGAAKDRANTGGSEAPVLGCN